MKTVIYGSWLIGTGAPFRGIQAESAKATFPKMILRAMSHGPSEPMIEPYTSMATALYSAKKHHVHDGICVGGYVMLP